MARRILHHRPICAFLLPRTFSTAAASAVQTPTTTTTVSPKLHNQNSPNQTIQNMNRKPQTRIHPYDVAEALRSESDPDLAFDIFRWTGQQRNYKHTTTTYRTMIQIAVSGKRDHHAETLVEEILAGACSGSVPLYNSVIKFCCGCKFRV